MTKTLRQKLIALITFLGGLYFFLEFILPEKIGEFQFSKYSDQITQGIQVVGAMSLGLGIINVVMVHGLRILRSQKAWQNSSILIAGMGIMFALEGIDMIRAEYRLRSAREFFDLAVFVERIDSDFKKSGAAPEPRIDALARRLAQINSDLYRPDSTFGLTDGAGLKLRNGMLQMQSGLDKISDPLSRLSSEIRVAAAAPIQDGPPPSAPPKPEPAASAQPPALTPAGLETVRLLKDLGAKAQELSKAHYESKISFKLARLIKEGLFSQLGAAMFSLLAFYIASAAYRSFRIRSKEAVVMMIAALIVMLGQIPHGPLYISTELPSLRIWLLKNINTPVNRAIFFGFTIAGLAQAVRLWLSLETTPLAQDRSEESAGSAKPRGGSGEGKR